MKNTLRFIPITLMLTLSLAWFTACQPEKGCTDPKALNFNPNAKESSGDCQYAVTQPDSKATLGLEIHHHYGTGDFDTATVFTTTNGQRFRMSTVRYYLSNFALVTSDNSVVSIPESYLLVKPAQTDYSLPEVPPGTYAKLRFYVGIDSATNSGGTMPIDRPAGHPLGLQNPSMFWSWSTGYIFLKMEGLADTLGTGPVDQNFSWHIGGPDHFRLVEIPLSNFTLTAGQTGNLHIKADINEIIRNIDFKIERMTHTMDNRSLALKISGLSPALFSIE